MATLEATGTVIREPHQNAIRQWWLLVRLDDGGPPASVLIPFYCPLEAGQWVRIEYDDPPRTIHDRRYLRARQIHH